MCGSVVHYISRVEANPEERVTIEWFPVKLVKLVHLPFAFQISCLTEIYDFL